MKIQSVLPKIMILCVGAFSAHMLSAGEAVKLINADTSFASSRTYLPEMNRLCFADKNDDDENRAAPDNSEKSREPEGTENPDNDERLNDPDSGEPVYNPDLPEEEDKNPNLGE